MAAPEPSSQSPGQMASPAPTGLWRLQRARKLPRRDVYSRSGREEVRKLARRPTLLAPHLILPWPLEDPVGLSFHVEADGRIKEMIAVAVVNRHENHSRIKKVAFIDASLESNLDVGKALAKRALDESHYDEVMTFMLDAVMTEMLPETLNLRRQQMSCHPQLLPLGSTVSNLASLPFSCQSWRIAATAAATSLDDAYARDPSFVEAFLVEQMVMLQDVGEEIYDKLTFHKKSVDSPSSSIKYTEWRRLSPNAMDYFKWPIVLCGCKQVDDGVFRPLDSTAARRLLGHTASLSCVNFLRKVRCVHALCSRGDSWGLLRCIDVGGVEQVLLADHDEPVRCASSSSVHRHNEHAGLQHTQCGSVEYLRLCERPGHETSLGSTA